MPIPLTAGRGRVPRPTDTRRATAAPGTQFAPVVEKVEPRLLLAASLLSHAGTGPTSADGYSNDPAVSANARCVAFVSSATNLTTDRVAPGSTNVFWHDRWTGQTLLVSAGYDGRGAGGFSGGPSISADGLTVAFESNVDLTGDDFNDSFEVFVWHPGAGLTRANRAGFVDGNSDGSSLYPVLSADGGSVAFLSMAPNLVEGVDDHNGSFDVFVRDLRAGTTRLASARPDCKATAYPLGASSALAISADGSRVAFQADVPDLVPGDANAAPDVFVRDVAAGHTTLASVTAAGTASGNRGAYLQALSADGRYVAFYSASSDLLARAYRHPSNTGWDIFRRDLAAGTTELVSASASGVGGNGSSWQATMTPDGRYVAFESSASNILPPGVIFTGGDNVILRDMRDGVTEVVSVSFAGNATGNAPSSVPSLSADGRLVAFHSEATNLVAGVSDANAGTDGAIDLFVRDRQLRNTTLLTEHAAGGRTATPGYGSVLNGTAEVAGNSSAVVFTSRSNEVVLGDTDFQEDVFLLGLTGAAGGALSGTVFHDADRDGVRDAGELPLADFSV